MSLENQKLLEQLPSIRETIETSELWAKSNLGQNFLLDLNITRKIVRAAGDLESSTVIEVGPGPGGLTRAILESEAQKVIALEKDARALKALEPLQEIFPARFTVQNVDALEVSVSSLVDTPCVIIANLPYNIATPLLFNWLGDTALISKMILMFQREVADRLLARPNTKDYGRISVMTQCLCKVDPIMTLSPQAFFPSPKVHSSVVCLTPYKKPLYDINKKALATVLRISFSHRRKMLRAGLKELGSLGGQMLERAQIDPTARPEDLTLEEFARLSHAYLALA